MAKRRVERITGPEPIRYGDGYHMHPIQARLAGEDREHWASVTVAAASDGALLVQYGDGHRTRLVRYLTGGVPALPVGTAVRLNQRYRVLAHPTGWLSVKVITPHPAPPLLPSGEVAPRPVIVDVSTGTGIALESLRRRDGA